MYNPKNHDKMNKVIYILVGILCLVSCQDEVLTEENLTTPPPSVEVPKGMQRVIVSSRESLGSLIKNVGASKAPMTRSTLAMQNVRFSNNEDVFISLVDANYNKIMNSLTEEQLLELKNDEDKLEYCPSDSIIADINFAQLLNADREIQIADTIFKYTSKGVAFTPVKHENELKKVDEWTKDLVVTPVNIGVKIPISTNTKFIPLQFFGDHVYHDPFREPISSPNSPSIPSSPSPTQPSPTPSPTPSPPLGATYTSQGIKLTDGTLIPAQDIREVNYEDKGDGGWLHRTFTGFWGRNVVAVKHFTSNKRLRLNFYDQNYIIYSNIGTKVEMQKRVLGFWWNIEAETIVQGWETITLKYDFPRPALSYFHINPLTNQVSTPSLFKNPFPFQDESEVLLHIPFIKYDFTMKDLNKAFQSGMKSAIESATSWAQSTINKAPKDKVGLFTSEGNNIYVMFGPFSTSSKYRSKLEKKLFAKWLPGKYEVSFSLGDVFQLKAINIDGNDHVELHRGTVYGAVKYNGRWLAARIIKNTDNK